MGAQEALHAGLRGKGHRVEMRWVRLKKHLPEETSCTETYKISRINSHKCGG